MQINSDQIIYSEHGYDECFEYINSSLRVPEGVAVGYVLISEVLKQESFHLFNDIKYSKYDHDYWDNYELEHDIDRVILP